MTTENAECDVAIVGGGLAGLALSILLARDGWRVIVFEKEQYPFHKVCGEYISLESKNFLESLGVPVDELQLPLIDQLEVSAPSGHELRQKLPLGGFGISRYSLDQKLVMLAGSAGVEVRQGTRVQDITRNTDGFIISGDHFSLRSKVCCGSFGKRSNVDVKWKRRFITERPGALDNFIGIKYHAVLDHPRDTIALHNFHDGYCGISPIEDNKSCICYLTTAKNLKLNGNNIAAMEKNVLLRNPRLEKIFREAKWLYDKPLAISQISFSKKEQVFDGVLLLGDAAGMITPLCGNGMSMALHAARLAFDPVSDFLRNKINIGAMEKNYQRAWQHEFGRRLKAGRIIQSLFGKEWVTNALISSLRPFPRLVSRIIRQTHG